MVDVIIGREVHFNFKLQKIPLGTNFNIIFICQKCNFQKKK